MVPRRRVRRSWTPGGFLDLAGGKVLPPRRPPDRGGAVLPCGGPVDPGAGGGWSPSRTGGAGWSTGWPTPSWVVRHVLQYGPDAWGGIAGEEIRTLVEDTVRGMMEPAAEG